MKCHRLLRTPPLFFLILTLCGCAYPISSGLRQQARRDLTFPQVLGNPDACRGAVVIWGGIIQHTENQADGTSITLLEYPLDWQEQPKTWKEPGGRFIVLSARFLDPASFRPGRRITVAGEISGSQTRPFNNVQYRYPVVTAREIYLWPYYRVHYYGLYGYPYWYGYGPYGPPYYNYGPYDYGPYNYGPYGGWWYDEPYYYAPFGFRGEFRERGEFHGHEGGEHDGGEHGGGGERGGRGR